MFSHPQRGAVNALFFLNGFGYANWIARLPLIQETYGLDHGEIGLLLLAIAVGALIAMPYTGWLIVRQGSRRIAYLSAWLFLLSVLLIPLAPNPWVLGVVFFGLGLTGGTLDVSMNAQAVLVEAALRRPIMTSFHAIFSLGMMLGAGAGALFTHLDISLLPHLAIVFLIGGALALTAYSRLVVDAVTDPADAGSAFRLPSRALIGIGAIAFCCMLGEGAMADWSTNYLEKIALADPAIAPLGLAAFSLAMMLGRFVGDAARVRWGDARLLQYSSLLALFGMAIIVGVISIPLIIAGCFLVGLGLATIVPIAYSIAGNTPGLAAGVGISMVTTVGYSGFLFGPPLIGFIADWQDLRVALGLILVLFLTMLALARRYGRKTQLGIV